jgi:putative glutamine amidotransferase
MKQKQPKIGVTLDFEEPGGYSKYHWYALRENYVSSLARFGALPLPLPHEPEAVNAYLDLIDGLVVTGGAFDVSPTLYGQTILSDKVSLKERRTRFEMAMVQGMLERKKPIFGICGGEQLLAVALGATLVQHIPDTYPDALLHEQPNPRHEAGHVVQVKSGTQLHRIIGASEIAVNSAHHQAVDNVPARLVVNAIAPDGVLEGVEYPEHPFCIGVQWHPEFFISEADVKLFQAFVDAAR